MCNYRITINIWLWDPIYRVICNLAYYISSKYVVFNNTQYTYITILSNTSYNQLYLLYMYYTIIKYNSVNGIP